jgi:predicted alpha/beta superfamily hydrolase
MISVLPARWSPIPWAIFLLSIAARAAGAQGAAVPWRVDTIHSRILAEPRPIYVAVPPGYIAGSARYPVLLVLDAEDEPQFAAAVANVRFLSSRTTIPELVVVGIPNTRDRTRDLTPPATGATAADNPTAGGADHFLGFLTTEALPFIHARYRTVPATILMGHSYGGLFGLYVAATRPGTFVGTIAASPALWWNDSDVVGAYAHAIAAAAPPQRIYVSHGEFEAEIGRTTARFAALVDSLVAGGDSALSYQRYAGDNHGLTPQVTLIDGIRFVFGPVSLAALPTARLGPGVDSMTVVRAVLETQERYAQGARALALPEELPVVVLNRLGYNVLQGLKKPGLAAWVFARNAAMYPDDANAHDSWGDALLALGDTAGAQSQFEQAIRLALRTHDPVLAESRAKLAKLKRPSERPQR